MMKWSVFALLFVAIAADVYIYRSVICRYFRHLPARIAYVIFAFVTDGAAVAALGFYIFSGLRSQSGLIVVMWLVWLFFLTTLPKLLFAAGGLLDYFSKLAFRRDIPIFRGVMSVVAAVLVVVMVCGASVGRTKLRVEQIEAASARVPAAFDGYKIVQISDLHLGTMPNAEKRLEKIIEKIATLQPDMVVNTGDLINTDQAELTLEISERLANLKAPDGVWTVWGNHDLGFYMRDSLKPEDNLALLNTKVQGMGWNTLSDRSVWIHRGGDSILLSGIDYPRGHNLNGHNSTLAGADLAEAYDGIPTDPYNIALSHAPQMWDDIVAAGRGDLVLSGHVHAMQMKIRLFGRTFSPATWMYDEWSGKYSRKYDKKVEKSTLYINDGIGCVGYPMRIGARPEITIITLKRCE
jgi:predicted MPP superfamily phosphohydrolase